MADSLLSIIDRFHRLGAERAYVYRRGYRTVRWSYRDVANAAHQFARELESRDIGKGDRVFLWGENCAEWVAVFFGCVLRGAVVVPMDRVAAPSFAFSVVDQVSARLLVCSRELAAHAASHPTLVLEDLAQSIAHHDSAAYPSPEILRTDPLEIVFTSGTTADPKGVVISHGNVLANLEPLEREIARYVKYERIVHPLRFLNLLPLSHVFGQFLGLFVPQALAATVVFHDSLNPSEVIKTVRSERISVVVTVPRLLESLRHKIERELEDEGRLDAFRRDFARADGQHFLLRWWHFRKLHFLFGWKFWAFVSGGAALDEDTERFWSRLSFAVVQGYGLTETTSLISVNHPFHMGRHSIGKVLPGRELKLDPATGEILVRGGSVATAYWHGRELKPVSRGARHSDAPSGGAHQQAGTSVPLREAKVDLAAGLQSDTDVLSAGATLGRETPLGGAGQQERTTPLGGAGLQPCIDAGREQGALAPEVTPEQNAEVEWFRTGDLGALDEQGNLYFKGRKKNVIVTPAGMNVYPEDLEAALRKQPEVKDAVVIALPLEGNAEPCAVLVLSQQRSGNIVEDNIQDNVVQEIVRRANQHLAEYQQVRRWLIWPEEDFPRTPTQKPKTGVVEQYAREYFASLQSAEAAHVATPAGGVSELIERITRRRIGELPPDARLESDLNLSSIDRVELMSAIEDRYQVDLNETSVSNATTVADLERLMHQVSPAQATSSSTKPDLVRATRYRYPSWSQRWPVPWIRTAIYHAITWPATVILAKPHIVGRKNVSAEEIAGRNGREAVGEGDCDLRGPFLIVSNHVTYVDIGFVLFAFPPHLRNRLAVAMIGERLMEMRRPPRTWNIFKRLVYQITYGLVVALFNAFPLPQKSGFQESFEYAGESADRGYSIVVFPEGRRTETGELQPFQSGVGLLATRLNLPVVPLRIDGLYEAKLRDTLFVRPNQITVRIGAPVRYSPNTAPDTIAGDLERRVKAL
ncbi:MAG TPA: AMP-binding protein [Clostridia bacterium]|nr:AMP-binding protein [Clostridia bacterium]